MRKIVYLIPTFNFTFYLFIPYAFVLCEFMQESQVGAYIDDKTLRRKKYANSFNQQKDDSCADTSNANRIKATNVKVFLVFLFG